MAKPVTDRSRERTRSLACGVLLVAMTLVAYLPVQRAGFIWDDDDYVTQNVQLRSLEGLARIWLDYRSSPQYYPLVFTTFWIEYHLWELQPLGYHLVNVLLHAANGLLVWRLLHRLGVPGSWLAAAVFALHPIQVESVAWITERKNVLSGLFYLAAFLAYLRFALPRPNSDARGDGAAASPGKAYFLALALYACALFSKTVTATLPVAILLVLWWRRPGIGRRDLLLAPFFAAGLVMGLITLVLEQTHVQAIGDDWEFNLIERCLIAGRVLWFYPAKLLVPLGLTFIYPRWQIDAYQWWQYLYPAGAVLVVAGLWLGRHRLGRGPLVAVLFYVVSLFPALGFFPVYPMRYSFVADHFQYLAGLGLIVLATATFTNALERTAASSPVRAAIAALILTVLGGHTLVQTLVYLDSETLWTHTAHSNPKAYIAHNNLGMVLDERGEHAKALEHFRRALAVNDRVPEVLYNVARGLALEGQREEAIEYYRKVLAIAPHHSAALNNLALLLAEKGEYEEAVAHIEAALRIEPDSAKFRGDYSAILVLQAKFGQAYEQLCLAGGVDPTSGKGLLIIGRMLVAVERPGEAAAYFRRALKKQPNSLDALQELAWLLATTSDDALRNGSEAVAVAERASALSAQRDPAVEDVLAAACAETGDFVRAIRIASRAVDLATSAGQLALAESIRARLAGYQQGRPWRHGRE